MVPHLSRRFVFTLSFVDAIVVSTIVAYLVTGFFPGFYSGLYDAYEKLFGVIAAIMILGPVMSMVVHKDDQSEFANDLCVIYLVKLVVVGVALHIAYTHRPVLTVFAVDRFVVVQAKQTELEHMPPDIMRQILRSEYPPIVAARELPTEDLKLLLEVMGGGLDIEYRPSQYEDIVYHEEDLRQRFCSPGGKSSDDLPSVVSGCEIIKVPLIYNRDQAAVAIFGFSQQEIKSVLFRQPW